MKQVRTPDGKTHITSGNRSRSHIRSLCGLHMTAGLYGPQWPPGALLSLEYVLNFLFWHPCHLCGTCKKAFQKHEGLDQSLAMPIGGRPRSYTYTRKGQPVELNLYVVFGRRRPS